MTISISSGVMSSSLPQILSRSQNGAIHSLFEQSFNIKFEEDLVNVNRKGNQLSSFGVNVPESNIKAILSTISAGDLVKARDAKIVIYSRAGTIFEFETARFSTLDTVLRPIEAAPNRLSLIHQVLSQSGFALNLGLRFSEQDQNNLASLLKEQPNSKSFVKASQYFVGRGMGLTPSGDDILTGFFFMLKLFSHDLVLTPSLIDFISQKTTAISVAYLKNLFNGYISEYFVAFGNAAAGEDLISLQSTVETIKAIGHTSGYDTLLGMSLGISKIEGETENSFIWKAIQSQCFSQSINGG
jgi:hypothetical protein